MHTPSRSGPSAGRGITLTLAAALLSGSLQAGAETAQAPRSELWLDLSRDSTATTTVGSDLRLALPSAHAILLGAARTTSPADQGDLDVRAWHLGLAGPSGRPLGYGLRYDHSGQSGVLESDRFSLALDLNRSQWSVSLLPEARSIRLYTDPGIAVKRRVDVGAFGLGASLWYYGPGNWMFGLEGHTYSYSKNPKALSSYRASRVFSGKTLTMSEGLLDHSETVDAGYAFENADLTLEGSRSVSAVDSTASNVVALKGNLYLFDPVRFGLELGAINSQPDSASYYATLSLGYAW